LSYPALISLATTRSLDTHRAFNDEQIRLALPEMPLHGTTLEQLCPLSAIAECVPGKVGFKQEVLNYYKSSTVSLLFWTL